MRLVDYSDKKAFSTSIGTAAQPAREEEGQRLPSALLDEARFFRRLGLSKPLISAFVIRANGNGTSLETELLASGMISEETYYEALAEILGLPYMAALDPQSVQDLAGADSQLVTPSMVRLQFASKPPITAVVPSARILARLRERLERMPPLRSMLAVTSPSALRAALWQAGCHRRSREATGRLFEAMPDFSARVTFWGRQGFYTGLTLSALASFAVVFPMAAALLLHIVLSLIFFAAFMIRLQALVRHGKPLPRAMPPLPEKPRPVYSIFVPLYREAAIVPQLVRMLGRLEWPRTRLDIKLICEADDRETIDALFSTGLGPEYEIVEVPPSLPRTKPKALCYALPAARGDYLVIYDAEDRADPRQLEEAWRTFEAGPPDLGCLQAPLIITNSRESWISSLFALEYSGLFRGLLPLLAASRLPMPLGGTSNHFRISALRESGGWDPYNVTEDADLGMRLFRLGHHCGVLTRPTFEDAPTDIRAWLGQRTRWFKGWLQTWLVMMRRPGRLFGEMGLFSAMVFQVLIGGLLLSSLAHPLILGYLIAILWTLAQDGTQSPGLLKITLFVIDIINIFGSYAIFIALGRAPMMERERSAIGWRWLTVGIYWLLISIAAWSAVRELRTKPFFWNKTTHQPSKCKTADGHPRPG